MLLKSESDKISLLQESADSGAGFLMSYDLINARTYSFSVNECQVNIH